MGISAMNQENNSIECALITNAYDVSLIDNKILHCCKYELAYEPKKIEMQKHGYKIFDNNKATVKARTEIANNIKTASCRDCWDYESKGQRSWRLIKNQDRTADVARYDASVKFNVQLSSLCNQSCMYCFPVLSSTIAQFGEWLDYETGDVIAVNKKTKEIAIEFSHIIDFIDNLPLEKQELILSITGGEPFIMNQFEENIERAIKAFVTKDKNRRLVLQLSTNGNSKEDVLLKFYDKIIPLQKEYKIRLEIGISLENIEERAEYVRQGLEWNVFLNNFNIHKRFANVTIKPTFNVFSVVNAIDFIKFFVSQNIELVYGTVNQKYLRMNILNESFIPELIKVEDYIIQTQKQHLFREFNVLKNFINNDIENAKIFKPSITCLLYTSDAADDIL
jgi:organic radical activating enzyme